MGTIKIAEILKKMPNSEKYKAIIDRASNNGYHDYKFDRILDHPEYADYIAPKIQLVSDLSLFPELEHIKNDVVIGKYDEHPDNEDKEELNKFLNDF